MPANINDAALDAAFDLEPEPVGMCEKCNCEIYGDEIQNGLCVFCEEGIEREQS